MKPEIKNLLRYIPPAVLIVFGWYAEVYWYYFRFVADGNSVQVAIAQGVALTLFLSIAATFKRGWGKRLLIGALVAYSVFATAAGQSYSLEIVRIANASETAKQEAALRRIADIDADISVASAEKERLQAIRAEGAPTLADQSLWRTALANLNEDIAEQEAVIAALTAEKLSIIDTGEVKPPDIYTRYSNLTGIPVVAVESIFQLVLSLFIALMAPVGVAIWPKPPKVKATRKPRIAEPKERVSRKLIDRWVQVNWMGLRNKTGSKILQTKSFEEFITRHGEQDLLPTYQAIHTAAVRAGVVGPEGGILTTSETEASERIEKNI